MFKRRTGGAKKKAFRKTRAADSDEDDDGDSQANNTAEQIQQAKKKRKLLTSAQYKRGVDTEQLLQQSNSPEDDPGAKKDAADAAAEAEEESSGGGNVATSRDGILEQKHSQAMAAYIEQQMGGDERDGNGGSNNDGQDGKGKAVLTKDALYAELAATSQKLAGKVNSTDQAADASAAKLSTEDLGSGGAVLVAGTGICEVILPVEERLKVARETEKAQQQKQANRMAAKSSSAYSTAVEPRPQGLPNRFFIPSRSLPQHRASRDATTKAASTQETSDEPAAEAAVDDDRLGFEGLKRQKEGGISPSGGGGGGAGKKPGNKTGAPLHHRDRANDLRVFRNFVSRERDKKK